MACNNGEQSLTVRKNQLDSTDNIAVYTGDDVEMNAAINKARRTYPEFLESLKNKCSDCERFNVKIRLGFGEIDGEHVWLDSLFWQKSKLYGVLASTPENVQRVNFGDVLEANPDSLSDWMYVRGGKLVGGYTIKAVYDRLKPGEQKQLEEDFGARIR